MFKLKVFIILMAVKNLIAPSIGEKERTGFYMAKKGYKIEKAGELPESIKESSGLEIKDSGNTFWTHGDGGCPSDLFEITERGKIISVLSVPIPNKDWEDMTKDEDGNIYIGDFGNNLNKRKELTIYKFNSEGKYIGAISFTYPDQQEFPPPDKEMNYDCEAIFSFKDSLYLFSKNRGHKNVRMYSLPVQPGKYVASVSDQFYLNSMITAADISPDRKTVALLSYGKIYFFRAQQENGKLKLKAHFSKKANKGQTEALVFINNTDLLISNEQGKLYKIRKKRR